MDAVLSLKDRTVQPRGEDRRDDPPHEHNVHPAYRSDIDGLRAVAILSVVLFHFFPSALRGGFVGVDIFFVISGFLISSIIFKSLQRSDFSFVEFYARRIKRIFPALIAVLASSLLFGWFFLLPDDYRMLGKHIASGAGFVQNIVLWNEAGYFDTASELKPLMHLWSLAIEEQFYMIYPVIMWGAWRLGLSVPGVLALVGLLSFGQNVLGIAADPVGGFFVPHARFWELLAGSGLACLGAFRPALPGGGPAGRRTGAWRRRQPDGRAASRAADGASLAGLLLIAAAVFGIHKGMTFPGWWALAPVAGAALLIWAGPGAWVNRIILSSRVMVLVGLISYPLYLWHWPVLTFARILETDMPSRTARLGLLLLSVVLAWGTYRFLERPIRFGKEHPGEHAGKTVGLSLLLLAAGVAGWVTFKSDGLYSRFGDGEIGSFAKVTNVYEYFDYATLVRDGKCHSVSAEVAYENNCVSKNERSLFIWGDSYAAALFSGLEHVGRKHRTGYEISQMTDGNGPPFFRDDARTDDGKTLAEANANRLEAVRRHRPKVVLIAWMINGGNSVHDKTRAVSMLADTVRRIKDASPSSKVIVLGPVPEWKGTLLRQVLDFSIANRTLPPRYMTNGLDENLKLWDAHFKANAHALGAEYVSAYDALCNENGCLTRTSDDPSGLTAVDWGHLSQAGARHLAEALKDTVFPD